MDIRMAEMDGITATAALRRLDEPPQVIVLTMFQACVATPYVLPAQLAKQLPVGGASGSGEG
jgi:DNA-binding NarL/FixJ family response regulator